MKEDQLPDCYVQANDDYYVCYVIEYDDQEHMDIEEREHPGFEMMVIELIKTCRICGQSDVSYCSDWNPFRPKSKE